MKYDDFVDKSPALSALIIIEGTELELSERTLALLELRARDMPGDLEVLRFRACAMDSFRPIAEALVALGFFSTRKLLLIRDVHELRAAPRRTLWEIAQTVGEGVIVVLEDLFAPTKKTKPEPLGQLAPRGTLRIDTTANAAVRTKFINEVVKTAGTTIEAPALHALSEGGADLSGIRNELQRLALDRMPIRIEMLARETLGAEDPKAYRYAGALLNGNDQEAFRIAADLFEDDPRGAAIPLLSALANEYALIWELTRNGGNLPARHRWRERALRPLAQRLGARVARRGFERALRGFEAIVTGRADDPRILVEAISAECAYERAAAQRRRS